MRRPVEISGADFLLTLRFEPENHADHFRGLSCNVPGALRASYRYRLQADFRYFTLGLKLNAIDAALDLKDLRLPPSNRLENLKGTGTDSTASASMTNGESALCGGTDMQNGSKS